MQVQATITKEDGWKRTLAVTVPTAEVETAFKATEQAYRQKAKIPGFRPGKVPLAMIVQRFAGEIRQDVLESVVPEAFEAALRQLSLVPLGSPSLSAVKLERGVDLTFEAEIEIRPQVEITGYTGLHLTKQVYEVTEADVDSALESIRDGAATTVEVQRPARENDVVTCDLQKIYDRLNRVKDSHFSDVKVELRSERARPELYKGLLGMSVGEGKEIEVTYPADESDPSLAGNTLLYRVWVKAVAQKNLPVLDDEFASAFSGGKLESLARLREWVRGDLDRRFAEAAMRDLHAQVRRAVVAANPFPVPAGFLNEYLEDVTKRLQANNPSVKPEAVRAQFEPLAAEQFRWDFAVNDIARREKITVTDEEADAILAAWPPDAKDRPDRDKVRWSLEEMKVYDWLVAAAQVEDVKYTPQPRIVTP
jgi:trigger factor